MMLGHNELLLCLVFRMQAAVAFYSVTDPWLPSFWAATGNFLPVEWFGDRGLPEAQPLIRV